MSSIEEPKEKMYINKTKKKVAQGNTKKAVEKRKSVRTSSNINKNKNKSRDKNEKCFEKIKDKQIKKEDKEDKENKEKNLKKIERNEQLEIAEIIKDELKSNRKLPQEQETIINDRIFTNICLAIAIMVYLLFLLFGFQKIENSIFVTDLKVFGFSILIIAIIVFEKAYQKDSNKYIIYGIEILVLAITTISLIYVNIMYKEKFILITSICSLFFSIYYVGKAIVIYLRMKKKYFIDKMKEITKK